MNILGLSVVIGGLMGWGDVGAESGGRERSSELKVDFRYAPADWQTCIGLPDDWQKTLVGKDGALLYDYHGKAPVFSTRISVGLAEETKWISQELLSPRVPIVRTCGTRGDLTLTQEVFAVPLPAEVDPATQPPRDDVLILRISNAGQAEAEAVPVVTIESTEPIRVEADQRRVSIGAQTRILSTEKFKGSETMSGKTLITLANQRIPPGGEVRLALGIHRGKEEGRIPASWDEALSWRAKAVDYWQNLKLPYGRIEVPEPGWQALVDSAIRNIYQAREIKKGLPAFQVGPTCYRGLWVVDGSFIMEAVTYLGRKEEARRGIEYLLSFQRDDGGFMLMDKHWKETGIVLWAVTRHARLTGDREWLAQVWPRLERGLAYIRELRKQASLDSKAPTAGLLPEGFSDGGLKDAAAEYTNIYWTLIGLRSAAEAARWLGRESASDWQREYDSFLAAFRRAAERDSRSDSQGRRYLPILMVDSKRALPQRAQWAFLHAVFPGRIFPLDDTLVRDNMAMLRAAECEGLVRTTGWLDDGLWTYFGSFYAHAWLWQQQHDRAIAAAYAFANHASPLLVWREEQMPVGGGAKVIGDMPHNWASAEFIRLVRHLLVLEREDELHLFESLPSSWIKPGAVVRLEEVETEFGPLSLSLRVDAQGQNARLQLKLPARTVPRRVVLHRDGWTHATETLELPTSGVIEREVAITGAAK